MGTMYHHAVIVTTWDKDLIGRAHKFACLKSKTVSNVVPGVSNGYYSFAVLPDGSKEGWSESDEGDEARKAILNWIDKSAYEDGSNVFSYAEVAFGDLPLVATTNDEPPDREKDPEGHKGWKERQS